MVDYEKGTASWDVATILTRHTSACDKAETLRSGVRMGLPTEERLTRAWATQCNCRAGDSPSERTSKLTPIESLRQTDKEPSEQL